MTVVFSLTEPVTVTKATCSYRTTRSIHLQFPMRGGGGEKILKIKLGSDYQNKG